MVIFCNFQQYLKKIERIVPIYSAKYDSLPSSSLDSVGRFVVVGLVHCTQEPPGEAVGFGQLAVGLGDVVLHHEGL